MKAHTRAGLVIGSLGALAVSGCGGGTAEAPPAASPPAAEEAPAPAPPAADAAPAPSTPADAPPSDAPADEPPADLGAGDTRTTDSIAALVKEHRKEARDCYEKALKDIKGLKGDVVIHFVLKPSGEVKSAELNEQRSTIREASVSSCVIGVIRAIKFPRSSKGLETTVNYPFNFNP